MTEKSVVVIDYGVGNTGSIVNILKKIGVRAIATSRPAAIEGATHLILPGVGSFDTAMSKLRESGAIPLIEKRVLGEGLPLLGICLGMQILTRGSEEGMCAGLGWIEANVIKFQRTTLEPTLRVPHMGWNYVNCRTGSSLFKGLESSSRFYFVHSYHAVSDHENEILCTTNYGYSFASGLRKGNIYGVQFHPEKSHKYGLALLRNFVAL